MAFLFCLLMKSSSCIYLVSRVLLQAKPKRVSRDNFSYLQKKKKDRVIEGVIRLPLFRTLVSPLLVQTGDRFVYLFNFFSHSKLLTLKFLWALCLVSTEKKVRGPLVTRSSTCTCGHWREKGA